MHYFEKNVVEIKNEYTNFLINIMTPLVYEGIKDIYDKSLLSEKKFKENAIMDPNIQNPGVLKIFQLYLKDIQNLNSHMVQAEYIRIKDKSKCSDWFDDLVKAVVKSNIILLTFNSSGKKCKLVNDKYHEDIKMEQFIHKSYIECARIFYNYPEIFYHGYSTIDIKRNQREAYSLIKEAINEAIRKMLPIKLILEEYLKKDYIDDNNDVSMFIPQSRYTNLNNLVKRDLLDKHDEYGIDDEYSKNGEHKYNKNDNYYDTEDNKSSYNKYSNSYNQILDEYTDFDDKFNDIDDEMDNDIYNNKEINDNITENLKDLVFGKKETNITNATESLISDPNKCDKLDEANVIKNVEIKMPDNKEKSTSSSKENLVTSKDIPFDNEKGMKILESIKKPRNVIDDILNQYKKIKTPEYKDFEKDINNINGNENKKLDHLIDNSTNKQNYKNIDNENNYGEEHTESISNNFDGTDISLENKNILDNNNGNDINIKIDKKINK